MTAPPPVAILAGGRGTRLGAAAGGRPKCLVDVCGRPFVLHQLELLVAHGIQRAVICTGIGGEAVRAVVGDGRRYGLDVDYSDDGPTPLGTAGALRRARARLGGPFLVLYGDAYLLEGYAEVVAAMRPTDEGVVAVLRNEGRWAPSNMEVVHGRVAAYDKWAPTAGMRHVDHGVALLVPEALDDVPGDGPADLGHVYQRLAARGTLGAAEVRRRFYEVGSPEGLAELRQVLAR